MKFEEALIIAEERNGGDFLKFEVQLGEDEGKNIPHFHLDNGEIGKKKKKTVIRLDMPYYFLHGDKTYIFNTKEKKAFVLWINQKLSFDTPVNKDVEGKLPKNNWENLRKKWNNYNPQAKIKCSGMPNYRKKKKDYKDA